MRSLSPRDVSASPPPSFYRDNNTTDSRPFSDEAPSESHRSFSPIGEMDWNGESERTRSPRVIQFAAPPPPITSSVFLSAPTSRSGSVAGHARQGGAERRSITAGATDPLRALQRRERGIQGELQVLLDAQSAGLVAGFGGSAEDVNGGGSEAGSSTPRGAGSEGRYTGRERSVVPVRQPRKKVITLRSARRGLGKDMEELIAVKTSEVEILENEVGRREEVLARVKVWEDRIAEAQGQLSGFSAKGEQEFGGGEEAMQLASLQSQAHSVDADIRACEERLSGLRAKQRYLKDRIKQGVNRREAQLSSYRGALREVEREVTEFLRRPPIERSSVMAEEEESFTALPPPRRTLSMAAEYWQRELAALNSRKDAVEIERAALSEGEAIWADVVATVTGFEDDLRRQMRSSSDPQNKEMLARQVERMQMVISRLSAHAQTAEDKGWNLLICAVGAELAAFREGEAILRQALGIPSLGQAGEESSGVGEEDGTISCFEREESGFGVEKEETFHSLDSERDERDDRNELKGLRLNGMETDLNLGEGMQRSVRGGKREREGDENGGESGSVDRHRDKHGHGHGHGHAHGGSEEDSEGPDLDSLMVDRGRSGSVSTID